MNSDFRRSISGRLFDIPIKFHLIAGLLIFLVNIAAYGHTLNYAFHFDDFIAFVENPTVHLKALTGRPLFILLSGSRPIANMTFALNFYFDGLHPRGYHFFNILVHILNVFLVYFIFLMTLSLYRTEGILIQTKDFRGEISLFAALLWAVHPIQTQAVTYVIQRMASLAAFFYLLSLFFYIYGRSGRGSRSWLWFGLSAASGLIAFGTKENTLTLPVIIFLYDLFFISRFKIGLSRARRVLILGLLGGLLGGFFWMASLYKGSAGLIGMLTAQYGMEAMDPVLRVMTEWRVIILYLTLLLFPSPGRMNLDYDFPMSQSLFDPMSTFLSLMVSLFLLGFAVWKAKKYPLISFSIFWFFVNLVIESSFLKLDLVFEHRLYLPSVMVFLPFSVMIFYFGARFADYGRPITLAVGVTLICILAYLTHERNQVWKTEVSLWSDIAAKSSHKYSVFYDLGNAYLHEGNIEMAIQSYRKALQLNRNYPAAHNNLGVALERLKKMDLAEQEYQEALRLNPNDADAHNNLGRALMARGQWDQAKLKYAEAVRLNPKNQEALNNLGNMYRREGNLNQAIRYYQAVLELNRDNVSVHNNVGVVFHDMGRNDLAFQEFKEAVRLDPNLPDGHNNLGNLYLAINQLDLALLEYKKTIESEPGHPLAHTNLGAVYLKQGKLNEAFSELELGLNLNPRDLMPHFLLGLALESKGQTDRAVEHYEEALKWALPHNAKHVELIKKRLSLLKGSLPKD